ncbi:MAG: hypothetical protein GF372_12465 [Candidatus Marinimicrobia bacterium]|nr:hypothetical protein [Candidatus Neomarinimicrobiota bacterium]
MNNKRRKSTISSMKELESLMFIPLTLAMIEMQHWQEEESEVQKKKCEKKVAPKE